MAQFSDSEIYDKVKNGVKMSIIRDLTCMSTKEINEAVARHEAVKEARKKGMTIRDTMKIMKGTNEDEIQEDVMRKPKMEIAEEAKAEEPAEKPKRKRRTKAEMMAQAEGKEAEKIAPEEVAATKEATPAAGDLKELLAKKDKALAIISRYKDMKVEIDTLRARVAELEKENTAFREELEQTYDIICEEVTE